jgi:hypothetical protein
VEDVPLRKARRQTHPALVGELHRIAQQVDEDLLELRRLEVESKLYLDPDIGVYIPATWITAALTGTSWNLVKVKKADIRSSVLPTESRIRLRYRDEDKVKTRTDVSCNPSFVRTMLLRQGQVKLAKVTPIFHDWSFESAVEFDPGLIDRATLVTLFTHAATYGGFGDFRPTYGRARFCSE